MTSGKAAPASSARHGAQDEETNQDDDGDAVFWDDGLLTSAPSFQDTARCFAELRAILLATERSTQKAARSETARYKDEAERVLGVSKSTIADLEESKRASEKKAAEALKEAAKMRQEADDVRRELERSAKESKVEVTNLTTENTMRRRQLERQKGETDKYRDEIVKLKATIEKLKSDLEEVEWLKDQMESLGQIDVSQSRAPAREAEDCEIDEDDEESEDRRAAAAAAAAKGRNRRDKDASMQDNDDKRAKPSDETRVSESDIERRQSAAPREGEKQRLPAKNRRADSDESARSPENRDRQHSLTKGQPKVADDVPNTRGRASASDASRDRGDDVTERAPADNAKSTSPVAVTEMRRVEGRRVVELKPRTEGNNERSEGGKGGERESQASMRLRSEDADSASRSRLQDLHAETERIKLLAQRQEELSKKQEVKSANQVDIQEDSDEDRVESARPKARMKPPEKSQVEPRGRSSSRSPPPLPHGTIQPNSSAKGLGRDKGLSKSRERSCSSPQRNAARPRSRQSRRSRATTVSTTPERRRENEKMRERDGERSQERQANQDVARIETRNFDRKRSRTRSRTQSRGRSPGRSKGRSKSSDHRKRSQDRSPDKRSQDRSPIKRSQDRSPIRRKRSQDRRSPGSQNRSGSRSKRPIARAGSAGRRSVSRSASRKIRRSRSRSSKRARSRSNSKNRRRQDSKSRSPLMRGGGDRRVERGDRRSLSRARGKGKIAKGKSKGERVCMQFLFGRCGHGNTCHLKHLSKDDGERLIESLKKKDCRDGLQCQRRECLFRHPPGRKPVEDTESRGRRSPSSGRSKSKSPIKRNMSKSKSPIKRNI